MDMFYLYHLLNMTLDIIIITLPPVPRKPVVQIMIFLYIRGTSRNLELFLRFSEQNKHPFHDVVQRLRWSDDVREVFRRSRRDTALIPARRK